MRRRLRELKDQHDVAISFLSGPNLLNAFAGRQTKTIVSERGSKRHDLGRSKWCRLLWTRFLDPMVYRYARWIVAASEGLAGEITSANRGVAERTIAIEGTVHAQHLLASAEAAADSAYENLAAFETIVAYGRFHVQKGFDFLLQVFALVRRQRPAARLLLIGDGSEDSRLRTLAENLHLRAGSAAEAAGVDVIFAGYQDTPVRFVRFGRVFVLPSRYEGLPNALIEALASGVPILAADCPWGPRSVLSGPNEHLDRGTLELPRHLAHGTLMPVPDQPGALETWCHEVLAVLARDPERRKGEECLAAISRFDIGVTGPEWLRIIGKAIDEPR
jgi:glycosyltransferase involved in cell wall biosynthesis